MGLPSVLIRLEPKPADKVLSVRAFPSLDHPLCKQGLHIPHWCHILGNKAGCWWLVRPITLVLLEQGEVEHIVNAPPHGQLQACSHRSNQSCDLERTHPSWRELAHTLSNLEVLGVEQH